MLYDSIYVFMFFMSNSSFYMFLLTYMHQNIKNIKNIKIYIDIYIYIYIYINAPDPETFKNGAPRSALRSRSRFQVTLVKHKKCGWINELYKRGKQLIKFITGHTRVNYFYGTYPKLQSLKLAKTRFASYYLTFRRLVKVRQALTNMVTVESWEEINTDRDGANVAKDTILDMLFWSQIKYVL